MSKSWAPLCALTLAIALAGCGTGSASKPAATVNGRNISMTSYSKQVSYQCQLTAESLQGLNVCKGKDTTGIRQQLQRTALNDLINEELVRQYAAAHHIVVPASEFNTQWQAIYQSKYHRSAAVLRDYAHTHGMTVGDVKDMVRFDLLQRHVLALVTASMPLTAPATRYGQIIASSPKELNALKRRLQQGSSFVAAARPLYAAHKAACGQIGCGDLGWLPNAFFPARERSIGSAAVNTLVGPFPMQQGPVYLYVEQHASHYQLNPQQQFAMRQQVAFPRWLAVQRRHASVHRYVAA